MHKGAIAAPIPIGQPTALIAADLERLKQPRYVGTTPQKLRDSHHMIARLAAMGLRVMKIAEQTGYSRVRVTQLLDSPAMQELVSQYRLKVDAEFAEGADAFFTLATSNMIAAERHIADQIAEADEAGELLPIRTALAISRDAADRFGYGKKSQQLNINVDFASQLERAIARSGKGPLLEASVAGPAHPLSVLPASSQNQTRSRAPEPQPLLLRRRA